MRRAIRTLALVAVCLLIAATPFAAQDSDHIFIRGVPISGGSNGLTIDADGHLVVADAWGGTMTVMDRTTGDILRVFGREYDLTLVDDVAAGPDGALYFTQEGPAGGIGKIDAAGMRTTIAALPFANPLAFSADGRLFAAQCFGPENGVYEIDLSGAAEPRLIGETVPGCSLNAFDFGPDGLLYGPSLYTASIVRENVDTGEAGLAYDGFVFPAAVEFDSQGRLHVADQATGQITRIDMATGTREVLAQLDPGLDNLVFDSEDNLYVSSSSDGFIVEIAPDGSTRTVSPGGMTAPAGIAVTDDSIFVAEPQAIRRFDRQTGHLVDFERSVFSVSDLGTPITVSAGQSRLILTSWLDNTVKIMDWQTREIQTYSDFAVPINAIEFQGDLIVAELGTANVVRASGDGLAQRDVLATLVVPAGLAATDDALWVADWATGVIWQLVENGVLLGSPKAITEGLAFPEGLAVTPAGQLVVVETATASVVQVDVATGEKQVIATGLAIEPPPPQGSPLVPTFWFSGIAVANDGAIYVVGRHANVIYRFEATS